MKSEEKKVYLSQSNPAAELILANKELTFQNQEKEKRAAELAIANKELSFQNEEKEKRAAELVIANKELSFQNEEKEKRAAELAIANKELAFQNEEKEKRAAELATANSYLNNLIGCANAPIIVWDPHYRITRFNQAFESLVGRRASEVLGQSFNILFPPDQAKNSMELISNAQAGERLETIEIDILSVDGRVHTVLWSSAVIFAPDGKTVTATIAQGQDITTRKQAENMLAQNIKVLQVKNAELERFLYTASHDLKSPVVTVRSFLGHLEKDIAAANPGRVATDLNFIHAASDKMAQLLDDLLGISRIGRVVSLPARVTLQSMADEALAAVAGKLSERGVRTQVTGGAATLYGDRLRLAEIWQNLVENACKYMGGQAEPRIDIGVEGSGAERVFFVRDNGLGIDPRFQAKIFDLFEKIDAKSEGTGVGLAIVHRIVGLYGGSIRVKSAGLGQGSCFYFTLPGAVSETQQGEKP